MTLATRCPACGTVFRVVQDQLRVSQGWVRCGRCSEAFNALESMVDAPSVAMPEVPPAAAVGFGTPPRVAAVDANNDPGPPVPGPEPTAEPPTAIRTDVAAADPPQAPMATPMIEVPEGLALIASDGGIGTQALLPADSNESVEPSLEADDAMPAGEVDTPAPETGLVEAAAGPAAAAIATTMDPLHQALDGAADDTVQTRAPSFLVQAERAERWRRPGVRLALGLLALTGVIGLAGQAIHAFRDRVAATFPVLRPVLQQVCSAWGCRIDDFRQIDALSVESSGLVRVEGAPVYRLSVTLRNRAAVEVAAPALDLTLTDAQGRQIARRVLLMSDLYLPLRTLKPGSELPIQVPLGLGDRGVSGYTVEIFYP